MRKLIALVAVSATLLAGANAPATDARPVADPQPILDRLQQKMAELRSVYLEFHQQRQLQLFAAPLDSEGAMLIDRPGRIRWETTRPYQSILLGNQQSVAQFECTGGQWNKLKLGFPQALKQVMEQMTLMHQGQFAVLTNHYTLTVATGAVTVVTLVPQEAALRSYLAALEIHFAPDLAGIQTVVMREPGGDFTRINFTREIRNPQFPARTFDQTNPLELTAIQTAIAPPHAAGPD
ncbi:MAG TPA: outer membrane lipoprotein carrier protein LolA [Verrucomicrobiota bacterium]|nr:outer membrane lipoprotein carrier protein LolA [Verrucomicrobiota bacterium]HNT15088.1 outer membrane lipoprotein carrier protein LolA [Verrucomicrobiota bacterium]